MREIVYKDKIFGKKHIHSFYETYDLTPEEAEVILEPGVDHSGIDIVEITDGEARGIYSASFDYGGTLANVELIWHNKNADEQFLSDAESLIWDDE